MLSLDFIPGFIVGVQQSEFSEHELPQRVLGGCISESSQPRI